MTTPDATSSKARDALIRESKDIIAINVIELCKKLHIRAMVGGGPVLNAHGLLTPIVSRSASLVVDPASIRHLRKALLAKGWRDAERPRTYRILPSANIALRHPNEIAGLTLYSVIPGFFADPEATFDLAWERRQSVVLRGQTLRALGRTTSAILATHDGLEGRASRSHSNFDYFIDTFFVLMDTRERGVLVEFIRKAGGCAEMNRLIVALGQKPCEFALPSIGYAQWRLQVADPTDQMRRALALLELGPDGRRFMNASMPARHRSVREAFRAIVALPKTLAAVFGAKRRWAQSLA